MHRFNLRLTSEQKEALRVTARYYGFTVTQLIRKWIEYGDPETFRQAWKTRCG